MSDFGPRAVYNGMPRGFWAVGDLLSQWMWCSWALELTDETGRDFRCGGHGDGARLAFQQVSPDVRLWSRDPEHAGPFARTRVNQRHLPGIKVPESIRITSDGLEAAD